MNASIDDDAGLADAFWRWTLDWYSKPGRPQIFMRFQDVHGLDVNLALMILWLAARGAPALGAGDVARAEAAAEAFRREEVVPHRALRRAAPRGPERDRLMARELELERQEQALLLASLPAVFLAEGPAAPDAARAGLALYARHAATVLDPADVDQLLGGVAA